MLTFIELIVIFGELAGGYLIENGKIPILVKHAELVIIASAAVGTTLVSNWPYILKTIVRGPATLIAIDKTGKATIREGWCSYYTRVPRLSASDRRPKNAPMPPFFPGVVPRNPAAAGAFASIPAGREVPDESWMVRSWNITERIQADL